MASNIEHGSFTIERSIQAPLDKVYNAFSDAALKAKWFGASDKYQLDFKVGGKEVNVAVPHEGMSFRYEALYHDISLDERLIYSYEMYMNDQLISVSLATLEFSEIDGQTQIILREDGVFLDGSDTPEQREKGTHQLLDGLAALLTES